MLDLSPSDPRHSNHLISTGGLRARRVEPAHLGLDAQVQLIELCRKNKNEVCGFITERQEVHQVKNVHAEPRFNFYMEKESCELAIRSIYEVKKTKIMGLFHTHPNNQPWPSPRDIAGWPNLALRWRYWIATGLEVIEWETYVP